MLTKFQLLALVLRNPWPQNPSRQEWRFLTCPILTKYEIGKRLEAGTDITGVSEIEAEVKLLRDQVDLLQVAASEKTRPWYLQSSNIVSVLRYCFRLSQVYTPKFLNRRRKSVPKRK